MILFWIHLKIRSRLLRIFKLIRNALGLSSTGRKQKKIRVMAASSAVANRKHQKKQEFEIGHVDINAVSLLPEKKDWVAEQNLQMLMLNG